MRDGRSSAAGMARQWESNHDPRITNHAYYAHIVFRTSTISNADRAKDEGGRMKDEGTTEG